MTKETEQLPQDRRSNSALAGLIATLMFVAIISGKAPVADQAEAKAPLAMPHPSLIIAANGEP